MSKGGYSPDCHYGQDIVMAFSPPVVGCLVKKGLQKGGGGGVTGTQGPPLGYAPDGEKQVEHALLLSLELLSFVLSFNYSFNHLVVNPFNDSFLLIHLS